MALVKQGGQSGIQKVSEETLQQRLNKLGIPQTTNAATAQGLGATPDQAKMAGAGNRKEAVLRQASEKTVEMGQQEQAAQPTTLSSMEQAELAAAERLTKLGGMSAQIGQMAQERLKQAGQGPVQRQVTQQGESLLAKSINPSGRPADYAAAKAALVDYANDPTKREQALATLANLGVPNPESYLERTDETLNRAIQTSQIKVADLAPTITQYGFTDMNDLAVTLGVPAAQLDGMSVTDLTNMVNQKRQELLDRRVQLEAGAAQTGLAGAAAQEQLKSFAQAGGLSREKEAARPIIDFKAKINVGGEDYDVETILKDDEFSNVIEKWLSSSPEQRATLIPSDWPLSQWLTANESSLKQSMQEGAAAQTALSDAQAGLSSLKSLNKSTIDAVLPGFDPNKTYTSAEIQNLQSQWANSKFSKADQAWLSGLSPEELTELKKAEYTEADLKAMSDLAGKAGDSIKSFLKLPDKKTYTKAELTKYKEYAALPDDVKKIITTKPDYYRDLSANDLKKFSGNPGLVAEYEEWAAEKEKYNNMNPDNMSPDALAQELFGFSANQVNQQIGQAKAEADLFGRPYSFPGDSNSDGQLSIEELRAVARNNKAELNKPKTVDSFITTQGYADYKPVTQKDAITNIKRDENYSKVRDWVDGANLPAMTNPTDVSLAMNVYGSMPDGPTKRALQLRMAEGAAAHMQPMFDAIQGLVDQTKAKEYPTKEELEAIRQQSVNLVKGYVAELKKLPQDWPNLQSLIEKLEGLNREVFVVTPKTPPAPAAPKSTSSGSATKGTDAAKQQQNKKRQKNRN